MARHKMSLDVNYVSDWGVQEALRELFQNAIDWGNWTHVIRRDEGSLDIISHNAVLTTSSLLLGHSRKHGESSIGKFGEGYKLAMLVLVRLGYKCRIYTGGEIWTPKLINSRTYKTQQLVFDTEPDSDTRNQSVSFYVEGLKDEDFTELHKRNLHLECKVAWQATSKGIILNDRPGDIFVGGLWVAHLSEFKYGYNFIPKVLSIDRDRRLVNGFDVAWLTCQMWKETSHFEIVNNLIKEEAPDTKYLDSFLFGVNEGFADEAAKAFIVEHGNNAVPVTTQTEFERAREEQHQNIVLVKPLERQLIYKSTIYTPPPPPVRVKSPREELLDFQAKWENKMECYAPEMLEEFKNLVEKSDRWVRT